MKIFTFFSSVLLTLSAASQTVGIGTNNPAASAQLDVSSTSKGMLVPRMTSAQRTAIANPVKGLLVYDTDLTNLCHFDGATWSYVGVVGNGFSLPFSQALNISGTALNIGNVGTAIAASSSKTSTAAVNASSSASGGYGILGSNHEASGFGTAGFSSVGTAIYGFSASTGTALKGISSAGYGLQVSGNLRLSGGNTSPSAGAVLTSVDASGNAVWKKSRIAFSVQKPNLNLLTIPANTNYTVHLYAEEFDYGNNYTVNTGNSTSFGNSVFVAPVSGLYHFDAALSLDMFTEDLKFPMLSLIVQRGINKITMANSEFSPFIRTDIDQSLAQSSFSKDVKLLAGDIVYLNVYHTSAGPVNIWIYGAEPHFGGHLIFEE